MSPSTLPTQQIVAGGLEKACREELKKLESGRAIARMWNGEAGLWKDDPAHAKVIADRLGWIPVLDSVRAEAAELARFAQETMRELRDIVLLGMGGSSLAPEVFSLVFPGPSKQPGGRLFFVLDSTDPDTILEIANAVDLPRTLFIVASKSGKTVETLSQFQFFEERLRRAGVAAPGGNFIAITDAGSHLDRLGTERKFRRVFRNPSDIGGRYSALSLFGLVPAALWSVDIAAVLDSAMAMRAACGPEAVSSANPALALGALLGAAAREGRDTLMLLSPPQLTPLGNWIEQLIAESTGKESRGIVPVAGGASPPVKVLADCVTVLLEFQGRPDPGLGQKLAALEAMGAPVVKIGLPDAVSLGAEFFKWEVATAVAGAVLGIDPFDEPNVQESKDKTARILEEFQKSRRMPLGTPAFTDQGVALYAGSEEGGALTTQGLAAALRAFFAERRPDDYLALLAYVARDAGNGTELDALRALLSERLDLPVLLGYGPRYMHSIGQLYKGGPPSGMFLVITSQKAADVPIPGAPYTFAELQMAQALGDLQSLTKRDKPALRLHLEEGAPAGLAQLLEATGEALPASLSVGS